MREGPDRWEGGQKTGEEREGKGEVSALKRWPTAAARRSRVLVAFFRAGEGLIGRRREVKRQVLKMGAVFLFSSEQYDSTIGMRSTGLFDWYSRIFFFFFVLFCFVFVLFLPCLCPDFFCLRFVLFCFVCFALVHASLEAGMSRERGNTRA